MQAERAGEESERAVVHRAVLVRLLVARHRNPHRRRALPARARLHEVPEEPRQRQRQRVFEGRSLLCPRQSGDDCHKKSKEDPDIL